MGSSRPNTSTGPTGISPSSVQALRRRLEDAENAIKRLQANRTPAPLLVHQLSNTGPMSQVADGQTLLYSIADGQYHPGLPHTFILGDEIADPTQVFSIFCEGGAGYEARFEMDAGHIPLSNGHAGFDFFCFSPGPIIGELSLGTDGGGSIGRFFADTMVFGGDIISGTAPPLGAGALGFFGYPAANQPTVTGSRGGNAALTSLLTALSHTTLAGLGLITDSTTP